MPVTPGTRLGPYEVLARIGEGGMGVVYRALDPRLDRQVAIKLLPADQQARERLRNEAMAAAALDHPNICKIFEIGEYGESLFLVMEYIVGETLDRRLRQGRMPLPETLHLAGEIAEALQEAHERGILHRDLKPSNIMLTKQGHVKIMDFGLAKRLAYLPRADDATLDITSPELTAPGTILGTPDYMSPEQVKGLPLDIRSDLFSFGVVLAEMAGARHPFRKQSTLETFSAVLRDPPDLNSDMPAGVTVLLQRLLAKSAEDRYGSAAEVRASLTGQTGSLRPERVSKIIDSLAVLPFENASRDPEHEYLSDGIAGSLVNTLATVPKLRVIAQSTVFRYKGRRIDPQAAGRELNVRAVLTGRIMQSGGSLRIGAELVDVATGSQLWGGQYDRKPGDIFAIQDEISNEISGILRLKLTRAEKRRLTKHQTDDAEAYRLYLKGRHHWNRWTEEGFYKAIEYFQQAVEKDPGYALAYTGLADSYVLLGWNSYLPPKEAFPKGKVAAMGALRLDPDLGEAHMSLAGVLWLHDWQWQEAQMEFKRSLTLNPAYPPANHWYAEYLMTMGRHEEVIARMKNSQELNPLSLIISVAIGWAYYMARRYDDAIEQLRRTVELDPNHPVSYWILGLLLRKMDRYEQAIAEGEKGVKLSGGSPLMSAALAHTFATAGRRKEAIQILDDLTKLTKQKYVAPYFFAGIHIGLGEDDRAIEYLEKSYEEHSHWLIYLHIDPSMDGLRSNPRFQDLLRRVGLPLSHAIPT
jgi:eukaryotic-like serine/threonine-protein kinase